MTRITLDLPDAVAERLEKLRSLSESISRVEVITKALALYDLVQKRIADGAKVLFRAPDGFEQEIDVR